jgi:hypothetical protein
MKKFLLKTFTIWQNTDEGVGSHQQAKVQHAARALILFRHK